MKLFLLSLWSLFASVVVSVPAASESSKDCHITASKAYVHAILTKTQESADAVPLHDDVVRIEGPPGFLVPSATNAQQLRLSFLTGPSALFVTGTDPAKPEPAYKVVNSTTVRADYYILAGLDAKIATVNVLPTRIEEYFGFDNEQDCDLRHIAGIFYIGQ